MTVLRKLLASCAVYCSAYLLVPPQSAHACGGFDCAPDQFLPREGTVPANVAAIAWWPGVGWVDWDADGGRGDQVSSTAADLVFECESGSAYAPVAFDVDTTGAYPFIRPTAPLIAGSSCRLRSRVDNCDLSDTQPQVWMDHDTRYLSGRAAFHVGVAAPLPASLGRLVGEPAVIEPIELTEGSGCSTLERVCSIKMSIAFSDEARPWKDAFVYETWVDGTRRWRLQRAAPLSPEEGGSYLGRGREILFANNPGVRVTADLTGLSVGRHSVEIRATLAGTNVAIATEPAEIDLNCFAEPVADAGTSPDAGVDASASEADAAVDAVDAGPSDAGKVDSPKKGTSRRKRDASCAAAAPDGDRAPAFGFALALAALSLYRRRRRS